MTDTAEPDLPRRLPPQAPGMDPAIRPPGLWRGLWLIAALELRQRLRSRALLVLAIVWFCIIGAVTLLAWVTIGGIAGASSGSPDGFPLFSIIVYFVLLFGTLVAPAISAGAIGAERSQATLATTQVTLLGTWSILLGKALAAWITGIAFLVVAAPFVVFSLVTSRAGAAQLFLALLALAVQIGVFTVIGVGLSALISSSVFAIVTAYLLVALLTIGTLIGYGLALGASTRYVEVENRTLSEEYYTATDRCYTGSGTQEEIDRCVGTIPRVCEPSVSRQGYTPTHRFWWLLALNPYVVVADMVPQNTDRPYATDAFGIISMGVRSLQIAPEPPTGWNDCAVQTESYAPLTTEQTVEQTVPVWWIGLGLQLLLVAGALWGGYRRLRTPAAKLPRGSRVA